MNPIRDRFNRLCLLDDSDIDLALGSLLISATVTPSLDIDTPLATIESWADEVRPAIDAASDDLERLDVLTDFLFEQKELSGNTDDYYAPENSFLDRVLDSRHGIPISLAVVMIEIGLRVGVPLQGVGFPGHFLVRHALHPQLVIDPFNGGRLLTASDCQEILDELTDDDVELDQRFLRPVGPREILMRMLNNLRMIYSGQGDLELTLRLMDRMVLLYPTDPNLRRDRGLLKLQTGELEEGVEDLELYLSNEEAPEDGDALGELLERVRECLGQVH